MARKHLPSLHKQFWHSSQKHKSTGFTLIELLIAMVIGSIALSLLLSLVVTLLRTDQQESVRNETQSEMQMALDYISRDMREAVYVYDGDCIQGRADDTTTSANEYCPGIVNHIKIPDNSVPILAFWKLEPLPTQCQTAANQTATRCGSFLLAGRTPSLIVYFIRKKDSNEDWQGQARITRYELDQFSEPNNTTISMTPGYVSPNVSGTSYRTWPRVQNNGTWTSLQTQLPDLDSSPPATLVDFVDARGGDTEPTCGSNYILSPSSTTLGSSFAGVRSFYACVRNTIVDNQQGGVNQDVRVFLRGNARGRPGSQDDSILPTLQTQVLGRGVVSKQPQTPQ